MFQRRILFTCLFFALVLGCSNDDKPAAIPPRTTAGKEVSNLFSPLDATTTGIDFVNEVTTSLEINYINFAYIFNGAGIAVLDFDNDGQQDLFFASNQNNNALYRNLGDWKFEDVSTKAGIQAPGGQTSGVSVVDVNADGFADLYVTKTGLLKPDNDQSYRANQLFVNQKDGTFKEEAARYGLNSNRATNHANFFDYDGDGDLDCYLLNIPADFSSVNAVRATQTKNGIQRVKTPKALHESDQLLRNDGGRFTDVSQAAGINNYSYGLSSLVHDFNGDGRPDIYIANDYVDSDNLYLNNGNGTFTDGADKYFRHTSLNSMGSDFGDINNDGLADLVAVDMLADDLVRQKSMKNGMRPDRYNTLVRIGYGHQMMRNVLQLNNGNGFSEIGEMTGISATDWSWAPLLADFDNDGLQDLFITNGFRYDITELDFIAITSDSALQAGMLEKGTVEDFSNFLKLVPSQPLANKMYRNLGELSFEDVAADWNVGEPAYSGAAVYADLDADGDLDLVVGNHERPPFVYRNEAVESGQGGNWLQVKAKGGSANPDGLGMVVTAYLNGQPLLREIQTTRGFLGSVEPLLQFGLGASDVVDRLEIRWPDGKTEVRTNVQANQRLTLSYADAGNATLQNPDVGAAAGAVKFSFLGKQRGLSFSHRENPFDDFNRQFLQPRMLSREGPALAIGDLNGDGLEDVFMGNAAGQAPSVFLQQKNGTFSASPGLLPIADNSFEDVEALVFDADGDGDNDLYVCSGGNAFEHGSIRYQDRLYLNDKGKFSRGQLPVMPVSTASVAPIDFDADGDPDLVVGGRTVPGAYPRAPQSYLLRNDGGVFTNVTKELAPELLNAGMVTAIVTGNVLGDERPEIIVAGEWMPITIFTLGDNGFALSDEGPANSAGLWRSLLLADINDDGRQEIIAGNEGLNSRFKPTPQKPVRMYAADFDGNGMIDPMVTVPDLAGRMVPLTTKAQLLKQLPGLKKKFVRTRVYARSAITDIFTPEQLAGARTHDLETLASTVFRKTSDGWLAEPLPRLAQTAPARSIRAADFNEDGLEDLLIVGNDYGEQVETGRMDAGNGVLLLNDGRGGWLIPPNRAHGFWASLDARRVSPVALADGKRAWIVANNSGPAGLFLEGEE